MKLDRKNCNDEFILIQISLFRIIIYFGVIFSIIYIISFYQLQLLFTLYTLILQNYSIMAFFDIQRLRSVSPPFREEVGRLVKRRGSGSSLQQEGKRIVHSRGDEVGRLFKRREGGSCLQEEGIRVVSSRGGETDRLFNRKGSRSLLHEERKWVVSSRRGERDHLFKRRGGGSSLQVKKKLNFSSRGREADRLFKRRGDGS